MSWHRIYHSVTLSNFFSFFSLIIIRYYHRNCVQFTSLLFWNQHKSNLLEISQMCCCFLLFLHHHFSSRSFFHLFKMKRDVMETSEMSKMSALKISPILWQFVKSVVQQPNNRYSIYFTFCIHWIIAKCFSRSKDCWCVVIVLYMSDLLNRQYLYDLRWVWECDYKI